MLALDHRWTAGEQLSEVELAQVDGLDYARWKNLENAYYQYEAGTLDEAEWEAYERIIQLRTGMGNHNAYLAENDFRFSRDFIAHVNGFRQ